MRPSSEFSLIRAIKASANGVALYSEELKMSNAGKAEHRSAGIQINDTASIFLPTQSRSIISAGGAGYGKEAISEEKLAVVGALHNQLVLVKAGATFLTGLQGDVSIPKYSGSNAKWAGENDAAEDGAGTTSEVNLTPKRLTTYIDVSTLFLNQDVVGFEEMLLNDIVTAVAVKLESTILGDGSASVTTPGGIFAGASSIGALSWHGIVSLESEVATEKDAYITNSFGRGAFKTTPKTSGSPAYIWQDNEVNGYPCLVTNAVFEDASSYGVAFGNWKELVIGQFGAIELTVDTISQKVNGNVRLVINAYFDSGIVRDEAFKIGTVLK